MPSFAYHLSKVHGALSCTIRMHHWSCVRLFQTHAAHHRCLVLVPGCHMPHPTACQNMPLIIYALSRVGFHLEVRVMLMVGGILCVPSGV